MRLALVTVLAASFMAAACSTEAEPGSPEWCKNTPTEKQVDDPPAMAKCLEQAAS